MTIRLAGVLGSGFIAAAAVSIALVGGAPVASATPPSADSSTSASADDASEGAAEDSPPNDNDNDNDNDDDDDNDAGGDDATDVGAAEETGETGETGEESDEQSDDETEESDDETDDEESEEPEQIDEVADVHDDSDESAGELEMVGTKGIGAADAELVEDGSVAPDVRAEQPAFTAGLPQRSFMRASIPKTEIESSIPAPEPVEIAEASTLAVDFTDAAADAPTKSPTLINVIGSLVLNFIGALIHLVDGPPILPANSSVTVRTSSLTLPIGEGRAVQSDWYFPDNVDASTRLIYLQHGFLASGPMYSYTAARLAEQTNAIVVAPSLSSNFFAVDAAWVGGSTMHRAVAELFTGSRAALTESASAAAGHTVTLPEDFVLVGHSAGGTLVTSAAGFMVDNGAIAHLAGIVMLDAVEPAGSRLVSRALAKLTGTNDRPIRLISSERYFWNRGGDVADKLALARPGRFNGVGLTGGLHVDYMSGGNQLVQFSQYLVGGFSLKRNVDAAEIITAGWVDDLFTGTTDKGLYGTPGQQIPVSTADGTATAVVLPLGEPARPVWPPLVDAFLTAIFDFGGKYWFVYEPLRGHLPTG